MKRSGRAGWLLLALASLVLAGDAAGPAADSGRASAARESWERYRVLAERNIFRRDRARPPAPRPEVARASAAPERGVVLTGIVRQEDGYIAFFEDRRAGTMTRARAGEALLQGRIEQITLDYVMYVSNDKTIKVEVGHSLEGAAPEPATAASAAPAASVASPAAPRPATEAGTRDEGAILERLRQRRAREMGGR